MWMDQACVHLISIALKEEPAQLMELVSLFTILDISNMEGSTDIMVKDHKWEEKETCKNKMNWPKNMVTDIMEEDLEEDSHAKLC